MDASRITQKRMERGMSIPELARRLGVAKSTIYRYESGMIEKMPVETLIQIAEILETSPAYLMFALDEDEEEQSSTKECFPVTRKLSSQERKQVTEIIEQILK